MTNRPTGDELLRIIGALDNPHRLRIIAALREGRNYVSQLARELGMSRPLLHLHLQRLEAAGLITGTLELSADGKAMKFFELTPFSITIDPELISHAASTLASESPGDNDTDSTNESSRAPDALPSTKG